MDGRQMLSFCSNDYLGLANHPAVITAFQQAAGEYGVGSGASHLVNGHSVLHQQLEERLAALTGRSRALLFSTGYMANLGTVNALLGRADAVFEDRLNHASLLDAGLLSGARFKRYAHNNPAQLQQQLQASEAERKLVITDGVFSMDGDSAPLPELVRCCQREQAWLMVDDAHGLGCLGEQGAGTLEAFGVQGQSQVQILMGTLGKALGTAGAFVAGSETLIETLIQQARPYIYTTAMPPAVAAATLASLDILAADEGRERRQHLQALIQQLRTGIAELGLELMESSTAIQPILIGDAERALAFSAALEARGIHVAAIRPPTVPAGTARLRITLSAAHSAEQVERLLAALAATVGDTSEIPGHAQKQNSKAAKSTPPKGSL